MRNFAREHGFSFERIHQYVGEHYRVSCRTSFMVFANTIRRRMRRSVRTKVSKRLSEKFDVFIYQLVMLLCIRIMTVCQLNPVEIKTIVIYTSVRI